LKSFRPTYSRRRLIVWINGTRLLCLALSPPEIEEGCSLRVVAGPEAFPTNFELELDRYENQMGCGPDFLRDRLLSRRRFAIPDEVDRMAKPKFEPDEL